MGYGVVRIHFNANKQAYQFYYDKVAAPGMPPHQHRYSFTSRILKGELTNRVYRITGNDPESTLQVEERSKGHQLDRYLIESNVTIIEACSFTVYEGQEYSIDWETYHTVESHAPKTLTLINKHPPYYDAGNPRYITDSKLPAEPYHHELGDGVFKLMSEDECWDIIKEVMKD